MVGLLRLMFGITVYTEAELLAETNADDLTVPVSRGNEKAERNVYELPREKNFTLKQFRMVRLSKLVTNKGKAQ